MNITSLKILAPKLLHLERFDFVLTYKFSQDHIELMFSTIRSCNGSNNNPNVQQFRWALRKMMFRNSITPNSYSNCVNLDLSYSHSGIFQIGRQFDEGNLNETEVDEIMYINEGIMISDFTENVLYICGYIVRYLSSKLACQECINLLCNKHNDKYTKFVSVITNGGLIHASRDIFLIVKYTETIIKQTSARHNKNRYSHLVVNNVVKHFITEKTIFKSHSIVTEVGEELHEMQLIKEIVKYYLKIRLNSMAKQLTATAHGNKASIRQKLTKLVLFNNT